MKFVEGLKKLYEIKIVLRGLLKLSPMKNASDILGIIIFALLLAVLSSYIFVTDFGYLDFLTGT